MKQRWLKQCFFPVVHLVIQEKEAYVCHGQTPIYCKDMHGKASLVFWLKECLVLSCPKYMFLFTEYLEISTLKCINLKWKKGLCDTGLYIYFKLGNVIV